MKISLNFREMRSVPEKWLTARVVRYPSKPDSLLKMSTQKIQAARHGRQIPPFSICLQMIRLPPLTNLKCRSASDSRISSDPDGLMCLELCSNCRIRSSRFRILMGPPPPPALSSPAEEDIYGIVLKEGN